MGAIDFLYKICITLIIPSLIEVKRFQEANYLRSSVKITFKFVNEPEDHLTRGGFLFSTGD